VGRKVGIGRRHQPELPAIWLAFRALRAKPGLRGRTMDANEA
jgi:hypothetical protein